MLEVQRGQAIRLVLDTNIVVSALLWQGAPLRLLRLSSQHEAVVLFTSEALLNELRKTLSYRKFAARIASAGSSPEELMAYYNALVESIVPAPIERLVLRHKDDDMVVATVIGAKAHVIVSGDRDLTELQQVAGIQVLRVNEVIELIEGQR